MYVLIVGAALNGLSGFATVLFVGATAYIADVSSKEERSFRIGEYNEKLTVMLTYRYRGFGLCDVKPNQRNFNSKSNERIIKWNI